MVSLLPPLKKRAKRARQRLKELLSSSLRIAKAEAFTIRIQELRRAPRDSDNRSYSGSDSNSIFGVNRFESLSESSEDETESEASWSDSEAIQDEETIRSLELDRIQKERDLSNSKVLFNAVQGQPKFSEHCQPKHLLSKGFDKNRSNLKIRKTNYLVPLERVFIDYALQLEKLRRAIYALIDQGRSKGFQNPRRIKRILMNLVHNVDFRHGYLVSKPKGDSRLTLQGIHGPLFSALRLLSNSK